jgi:hypothetical protein
MRAITVEPLKPGSAQLEDVPEPNQAAVLKNNVIVGSVNANKRHWYKAGQVLARAELS